MIFDYDGDGTNIDEDDTYLPSGDTMDGFSFTAWTIYYDDESIITYDFSYLNIEIIEEENSMKANINARFQTVILGSIISNLSKADKQEVMVGLLKYGKSESDWSSAHYKAQ